MSCITYKFYSSRNIPAHYVYQFLLNNLLCTLKQHLTLVSFSLKRRLLEPFFGTKTIEFPFPRNSSIYREIISKTSNFNLKTFLCYKSLSISHVLGDIFNHHGDESEQHTKLNCYFIFMSWVEPTSSSKTMLK